MPKMQSNGVQVVNKVGVYKKFKDVNSPNAISWAWSYHETDPTAAVNKQKRVKMTAEERLQRKAEKKRKQNEFEIYLYGRFERAFEAGFDGCDPIDFLGPVMDKYGIDMKEVDRIWAKWGHNGKKGFYASLKESWSDTQGDRIYDAKNGHIENNSPFYRVVDGEIIPEDNPW